MPTIHVLLGKRAGVRSRTKTVIDGAYKRLQRVQLFSGGTKRYTVTSEEDPTTYPDSEVVLQATANGTIKTATDAFAELIDANLTVDMANMDAAEDVSIDGAVIASNVPATSLIMMEKRLTDLHTLISHAPVLDPAERWELDTSTGTYRSAVAQQTIKTRKVVRFVTVFAGNEQHAPDIRERTEDVPVGKWTSVNFSGALPAVEKAELLSRVDRLRQAVREARERANELDAQVISGVGAAMMSYVLTGTTF